MAGWIDFANGTYLDEDGLDLLMKQTVAQFATTAERDALIASPWHGQVVYVTGVGMMQYNGSSWRVLHVDSPYTRYTAPAGQTFPDATWRRVNLNVVGLNSGAWTHSTNVSGSVFTCAVAGRYQINAFLRFATGVGAGMKGRSLSLADNVAQNSNVAALMSASVSNTDYWAATLVGERTFAVSDTLCVWGYQDSGATITPAVDYGAPFINIRRVETA